MASHIEVAHRWAQRNSKLSIKGFNMYADGLSLFSYGRHFELARHVETTPREGSPVWAILVNGESRSISTSKHQNYTRRAIRDGDNVFTLPTNFWPVHGSSENCTAKQRRDANKNVATEALKYYEAQALEEFEKATRARVYTEQHIQRANGYLREAEKFAEAFGVKFVRPDVDDLRERAAKRAQDTAKAARKAAKAQQAAQAIRDAEQAELRAVWIAGGDSQRRLGYFSAPDGSAYVRRSPDGESLETSQGAVVPWEHAVKAFRFVKLCRERGEAWHTNGRVVRVGHYQVDEIDAEGNMRAGCHRFTWSAMNALAIAQGVFDAPSSEAVEQR